MKKKIRRIAAGIIFLAALVVFFYSAYQLCGIFFAYHKGTKEYDALKEIALSIKVPAATEEESEDFVVDFDALSDINSEVVGWLRFDEPSQISYPLVQGANNETYLKYTFEGNQNAVGAIFVDAQNAEDFSDKNTFIYGHNMKNGSMFGKLRKYKSQEFCQENPYFYIYTPDGIKSTYQVFAACIVTDGSESYTKWYETEEAFSNYIAYIRSIALYQTDAEVTEDSQIVSLSTCTNVTEEERLLVHGVKIGEKVIGGE